MVIQTRFGFGEMVWFLRGSMVDKGCVFSINVDVRYEGVKVKYTIQYSEDSGVELEESKVFATREEAEAYGNR